MPDKIFTWVCDGQPVKLLLEQLDNKWQSLYGLVWVQLINFKEYGLHIF